MQVLRGKVAVITGAGSGIGRALAEQLAREGCALALADINAESLHSLAATLQGSGVRVTTHVLDVAKRAAVYAFADEVLALHGSAQLIINNAGVSVSQTVAELTYDDFEWIMGINFWGVVYGTKAFLPHLLKNNSGHIVNVSSIFGIIGVPTQAAYNASKFAVRGFTEALRQEVAPSGVRVSCVHPGGIKTNIARSGRFYRDMSGNQDASRSIANFDKIARTTPAAAAEVIIEGIKREQPRILIGADARLLDRVQRLLPVRYARIVERLSGIATRRF
jgi:NAD(P)-dependent dehydrogenase (short-subunit alcohol dehydrogenase family)